ncbi:hypothetical protein NDU88_001125 [Pleurodeles waltl]|uniref:Uncharacterized protein n=1 Tax=Pleurodeles waltl TaxID=8319 RepID=A0AAV7V7L3_PLEWA|nr:hypothetical protein NDU88_001125 [Pleurodeles waltl]
MGVLAHKLSRWSEASTRARGTGMVTGREEAAQQHVDRRAGVDGRVEEEHRPETQQLGEQERRYAIGGAGRAMSERVQGKKKTTPFWKVIRSCNQEGRPESIGVILTLGNFRWAAR